PRGLPLEERAQEDAVGAGEEGEVGRTVARVVDVAAGAGPGWRDLSPPPRAAPENWSKKSLNAGSSANGPSVGGRRNRATWTVPIWTTAGRTRSATLTKADCRASAVLAGPSGPDPPAGGGAVRSAWSQKPPPRKAKRALARRTVRALLGAIWSPDGSRVRLSRNTGTDAIHLMLECQGNYCNHVFSLTLPSAKRDNETI